MNTFPQKFQTIVIGGGQSGLAAGYYLKEMNQDFLILDNQQKIGDSWRKRWESLLLFTPAQYDGLPGMPFPGVRNSFPNKDEMADYLEEYARKYSLPVRSGTRVEKVTISNHDFEISNSSQHFIAEHLVIATGTNPVPKIPAFAGKLDPEIYQMHSSQYNNPGQIPAGDVLVVGAGTSGIEIAIEVSKFRKTYISGKPTFHIPDPVFKYAGGLYWWFANNILTVNTPIGRKAKTKIIHGGGPLIRISAKDLDTSGVTRLPKMTGVKEGCPVFGNGTTLNVSTVIWATGYKPDFSWITPDITDDTGWPVTVKGVSAKSERLYFIGMPFQSGLTSGLVGGVAKDARYITHMINKNSQSSN